MVQAAVVQEQVVQVLQVVQVVQLEHLDWLRQPEQVVLVVDHLLQMIE
jgi:hypothetical protein